MWALLGQAGYRWQQFPAAKEREEMPTKMSRYMPGRLLLLHPLFFSFSCHSSHSSVVKTNAKSAASNWLKQIKKKYTKNRDENKLNWKPPCGTREKIQVDFERFQFVSFFFGFLVYA